MNDKNVVSSRRRFFSYKFFLYKYFTFLSVSHSDEKKKSERYKRFCAINYRDRLRRELESIRLRNITCERNERKKVDVSALCHGPVELR